jgi:hypothetical protein
MEVIDLTTESYEVIDLTAEDDDDGVYGPTSPCYSPDDGAYSPTSPCYSPDDGVYGPTSPCYSPDDGVYGPTWPSYGPTSPCYTPNTPTAQTMAPTAPPRHAMAAWNKIKSNQIFYFSNPLNVSNPFLHFDCSHNPPDIIHQTYIPTYILDIPTYIYIYTLDIYTYTYILDIPTLQTLTQTPRLPVYLLLIQSGSVLNHLQ